MKPLRAQLIAFLCAATLAFNANAQTTSSREVRFTPRQSAQAQRVDFRAKSIGLWTPLGARTEYLGLWRGSFSDRKGAQDLVAHFYSVPTPRNQGGDGGKWKFGLFLDLWRRGKSRPVRLNHLALRTQWKSLNGNWDRQSDRLSALYLRRLDARGRTLMLQATGSGQSISGVVGCEALAIFPNGLNRAPRLQSFDTYGMTMGVQQVFFNRRDKRGILMARIVNSTVPLLENEKTVSSTSFWRWNGRAFVDETAKRQSAR